jgi:hypothetical protein
MATKSRPAAADEAKATYLVISPLEHGEAVAGVNTATLYAEGDEVELTAAQAAPLLGHTVKAKPAARAATHPPQRGAERSHGRQAAEDSEHFRRRLRRL